MIKTIIVSILSDHAIPNYLFIKEMEGKYDKLVFITTEYVANKHIGRNLEQALGVEADTTKRILVSNDDYSSTMKTMSEQMLDKECQYVVNITGGTKVMSLAIFDFFREFASVRFVYVPIGRNVYCDVKSGEDHPLNYRVTLKEYFALYGMTYKSRTTFAQPSRVTNAFFDRLRQSGFRTPPEIRNAQEHEDTAMRSYYSGGWFEEYTYSRIKKEKGLKERQIAMSLKIFRDKSQVNDNEIDVAFVFENALYVIECKYTMFGYGREPHATIEEYLYKLAAICKDLGLIVNPYLFTLHPMGRLSEASMGNLKKRMRILGIKGIVGRKELKYDNLTF